MEYELKKPLQVYSKDKGEYEKQSTIVVSFVLRTTNQLFCILGDASICFLSRSEEQVEILGLWIRTLSPFCDRKRTSAFVSMVLVLPATRR